MGIFPRGNTPIGTLVLNTISLNIFAVLALTKGTEASNGPLSKGGGPGRGLGIHDGRGGDADCGPSSGTGAPAGGINLHYLSYCCWGILCRQCLMPDCECQDKGLVGQQGAEVKGGLKRYPNWDPRSEYYQSIMTDVTYETFSEEERE